MNGSEGPDPTQGSPPPGRPRESEASEQEVEPEEKTTHVPVRPQPHQSDQADPQAAITGDALRRKRSRRRLLVGAGILVVLINAVVLVLGLQKLGWFNSKALDVSKAQAGVQQVLTDPVSGYGAKNVTDVVCNNGQNPTAEKGDSFTCEVSVNGRKRHVTVVFRDDNGTYEVDRPR
jgi:Domain of unknown function (DUF4333)